MASKNTITVSECDIPAPPPYKNPFFTTVRDKIKGMKKGGGIKVISTFDCDIIDIQRRISTITTNYSKKMRITGPCKFTVRIIDDETIGIWRTE